jgi:hypothetical protein
MSAWYRLKVIDLKSDVGEAIVNSLSSAGAKRNLELNRETVQAWHHTVATMMQAANYWMANIVDASEWTILFEYEVPRRSRRIDVVVLARDVIVAVEFKVGAVRFDRDARWQTEQYALDLRDFHKASRDRKIVPILVATEAESSNQRPVHVNTKQVSDVYCVSQDELAPRVASVYEQLTDIGRLPIDARVWDTSPYQPTPWIVAAAQAIFQKHDVREIKHAESQNLDLTVDSVFELVRFCKSNNRHGIAFITGAPGSGKTLAGLQVVHDQKLIDDQEAAGVFLSGNMPLVEVIREALNMDATKCKYGKSDRQEIKRRSETFIQHAYAFRNEHVENPDRLPHEHIILFDEAQRAWDSNRVKTWMGGTTDKSEPELFLEFMGRFPDWSVIIAVVGSGQEINRGEAGLGEWGRAIEGSPLDWVIKASPHILSETADLPGGGLFDQMPSSIQVLPDPRLHLNMNVRSPRAENLNRWVDSLIDLKIADARTISDSIIDFPLVLTRDLNDAKKWLWDRTDDDHRCGLLANADARRLRAWGLDTRSLRNDKAWADWFLKPRGDIRSSNQLEIPASNFDCQGLELDYVGMCWGSDMTYDPEAATWRTRKLRGTSWQEARDTNRVYMLNSYRVLLTRARKGMVIWVPSSDGNDKTINSEFLDATAELIMDCGIPKLEG